MTAQNEIAEARAELARRIEGYISGDSIGAAIEWLDSDDAVEMIEAADLSHLTGSRIMTELTGVSI